MKQPTDHLRKQPHRAPRKPGRHDSPARRAYNLRLVAARTYKRTAELLTTLADAAHLAA